MAQEIVFISKANIYGIFQQPLCPK